MEPQIQHNLGVSHAHAGVCSFLLVSDKIYHLGLLFQDVSKFQIEKTYRHYYPGANTLLPSCNDLLEKKLCKSQELRGRPTSGSGRYVRSAGHPDSTKGVEHAHGCNMGTLLGSMGAHSTSFEEGGFEVARDSATFCPLGEDRIAMYSVADGSLTATLPAGWNPQEVSASSLFADRKEPANFKVDGRRVTVPMQSRRPVMIYRTKATI